ncbi:MAG: UDP-N-acetylmuramate dehydrogenase [Alicyclobacillus herbarius]|uniref:UDP-N-acetylmuramate dehydrogenase n=1 Tax=Alicyclobacillus herbarius TaxID=122960 RepID=UPI000404AA9F|nr:UDP-N-acetylmuramate dehydrogenase [Alicyclobacillus herbarius]MCL6631689.1 UDP-N-acetylmuramate dehydrogenase [Alicyclobacillus herbarius]
MKRTELESWFERYHVRNVEYNAPLSVHTTWRIGGPADVLVVPDSVEEVRGALLVAERLGMPWTVIGRGSNLLVLDGGVRGLVLKMGGRMSDLCVLGTRVVAQAGRSFVSLANVAIRNNLRGLEFATGIPGTVGGAVMMDAGAHGGEVRDVLEWADVITPDGTLHRLSNADLRFDYRYSILKDWPAVVISACFRLEPGNGDELKAKVREWSKRRASTQPLSMPNCGSVFRNPPGTFAARLIEAAGLKGLRRGDAQISEKHANFIVNLGHANAEDVLWLMRHAQETVRAKYGITLETEVRVIGDPASGR